MTTLRRTLAVAVLLAPVAWLAPGRVAAQAIDATFASPSGVYTVGSVYSMGPQQADGKRLLTGSFTRVNGAPYVGALLRLDANGATDAAFAQNVGAAGNVYRVKGFANGQYLLGSIGGPLTAGGITRNEVLKLNADGTGDASFDPGTGPDLPGDYGYGYDYTAQPDGKVLVAGYFSTFNGAPASGIVRLNANGSVDTGFTTGTGVGVTAGSYTYGGVVAVQPDGKVLLGGYFTAFNGQPAYGLVRLNANGSTDTSFAPPFSSGSDATAIVVQPDGKLLISGYLSTSAGSLPGLVRLNANGSLDTGFAAPFQTVYGGETFDPGVVLQADGKLVVMGYSSATGTQLVARLNANGSFDNTFYTGTPFTGSLYVLGVQANGSVLTGGYGTTFNGSELALSRLTASGSFDVAFTPKLQVAGGILASVRLPDGRLVLGGTFSEYNGVAVHQVVRVSAAGVLDGAFSAATSALPGTVNALALQPDGKLLVGTTGGVRRLGTTGAPDTGFNAFAQLYTTALAVQPDGKVVVGGSFTTSRSGVTYRGLVRLTSTGDFDGTFVQQTNANVGTATTTEALLVQANGKIVTSGRFTVSGFPSVYRVVRYESTGALDATFTNQSDYSAVGSSNTLPHVYALAQQPDGKLLVAGNFAQANSSLQYSVARLTTTGDVDPTFNPTGTLSGTVYAVAVQPNGRVLLGGSFSASAGSNLARVLATGAADASFAGTATPNTTVRSLLVQPDGGIVLSGYFTSLSSVARPNVARITAPNVLAVAAPAATAARTLAWPVPAHSVLHIAPDLSARPQAVELLDGLGRALRHQPLAATAAETTLDVEGLAAGLYLLRVQYATGSVTRAITVE